MPEPSTLTPRQKAVLDAIADTIRRRGYPPTCREIGDAVGLSSTASVHHQLRTLERRHYIRRTGGRGQARALELIHHPPTITPTTAAHVLHEYGYRGKAPRDFTRALIEAIARADVTNRAALADTYPGYVAAVTLIEDDPDGAARLTAIAGIPASRVLCTVPAEEVTRSA